MFRWFLYVPLIYVPLVPICSAYSSFVGGDQISPQFQTCNFIMYCCVYKLVFLFLFLCNHARQRVLLLSTILSCSSVRRHFVLQLFGCSNLWRQKLLSQRETAGILMTAPVSCSLEFSSTIASQRTLTLMSPILSELYGCICLRGIY